MFIIKLFLTACQLANIMKRRVSIKDNKTNCRVSFIDFYLVFPTNLSTYPHTNSVMLQESTCGTITEPGMQSKIISYLYSRLRDGNGCAARTMEPECLMPSK